MLSVSRERQHSHGVCRSELPLPSLSTVELGAGENLKLWNPETLASWVT